VRANGPSNIWNNEEVQQVLSAVDQSTLDGRRDYALLAILSTPALGAGDTGPPRLRPSVVEAFSSAATWEGRKERFCPLWPQTARLLRSYCKERQLDPYSQQRVFLNHRGEPLTRFVSVTC